MQKDTSRFTAVGGQYIGKVPPTTAQKKAGKKITSFIQSVRENEKDGNTKIF